VLHALKDGHPEHGLQSTGPIKAAGLSLHSFLDGVAIGAAFHVGFELGLVVALAVVFHDFSDGLNTVTVMLRSGRTKRAAFSWLLLDSIAPMLGAITTFLLAIPVQIIALILPFFVGEFLYLGAADLLPEAHSHGSSARVVLATVLGTSVIFIVTRFLQI
jgi:ZIP family zinc transporter